MNKKNITIISIVILITMAILVNTIYRNSDYYLSKKLKTEKNCLISKTEEDCKLKKKECKWDNTKKSFIGEGLCIPR